VTSTHLWRAFDTYNGGKPWAQQVKPANFLLTIGINPMSGDSGRLVAPYEPDSARWLDHDWYRLSNGHPVTIDTQWSGDASKVLVETFRDVLMRHVAHPEAKFLAPTGETCLADTRGLLQRRPTISAGLETIGKEANLIEETQAGVLTDDATLVYSGTDHSWARLIEALRSKGSIRLLQVVSENGEPPRNDGRIGNLSSTQVRRMIRTGSVPRNPETRRLIQSTVIQGIVSELLETRPSRSWMLERDEVLLAQFLEDVKP
jgi:hypothetical protein